MANSDCQKVSEPVLCCCAGNFPQALGVYSRALRHAPNSARVLVNAALVLLKLSQPHEAHEKATLAIGVQPRNAKAYHARHKAKEALGDFKVLTARRGGARVLGEG